MAAIRTPPRAHRGWCVSFDILPVLPRPPSGADHNKAGRGGGDKVGTEWQSQMLLFAVTHKPSVEEPVETSSCSHLTFYRSLRCTDKLGKAPKGRTGALCHLILGHPLPCPPHFNCPLHLLLGCPPPALPVLPLPMQGGGKQKRWGWWVQRQEEIRHPRRWGLKGGAAAVRIGGCVGEKRWGLATTGAEAEAVGMAAGGGGGQQRWIIH